VFRWNMLRVVLAIGAFAAFVVGSGAGWYWN
jgi:hypothetical protein